MAGKYYKGNSPPVMPRNPDEGAEAVKKAVLKVFSRTDGEAADWALMAESLLKVAFDYVDRVQDDERRRSLLRRIEAGTYDRMAGNAPDPWQDTPAAPGTPAGMGRGPGYRPGGMNRESGPRPPSRRRTQ